MTYDVRSGCIDNQDGKDFKCTELTDEGKKNIVGLQGCMWSEENIEEHYLWEQMFPRMAAVADRAYKAAKWEDIYGSSSWDAVQDANFTQDFSAFRYAIRHFHT